MIHSHSRFMIHSHEVWLTYVRHESCVTHVKELLRARCDALKWDMSQMDSVHHWSTSHSHSFTRETWLIHDSIICDTTDSLGPIMIGFSLAFIHMRDMTRSCQTELIHDSIIRDLSQIDSVHHWSTSHSHSFTRETRLIHTRHDSSMTQSYVTQVK